METLAVGPPQPFSPSIAWRAVLIRKIYARHNDSRAVRRALSSVLAVLDKGGWGVNIGGGGTSLHPRLVNLDLNASPQVDLLGSAERLPFGDGSLQCVVSQEVFEHLADPHAAAREVARVLRPGGLVYLQVPFIIGFHSGPNDFWRFSARGLGELLIRADLEVLEVAPAVGAGTSMYRIAVEFTATLAASIWKRLYRPVKGLAAVLFVPLRLADSFTTGDSETNRIAAGFYAIARKK